MVNQNRIVAAVFLLSSITILIVSIALWVSNEHALLLTLGIGLAPLTAAIIGLLGLTVYGRDDFRREDRFHLMNIFFSLGLVLYAISEIAAGLLVGQEGSEAYLFTLSLIQMPGLILWAIGVLGYLRASNAVLQKTNDKTLVGGMIVIPSTAMVLLTIIVTVLSPERDPIEVLTTSPLAIGMGAITLAMAYVLIVFRGGRLAVPLGLAFVALFILTMQIILWCCFGLSPVESFGQVVRTEAYIILGASLTAAKSIERF
ncbi:MAG: hypothetical protein ACFFD6_06550 [Candidatus Thorarchaeota archaeon]